MFSHGRDAEGLASITTDKLAGGRLAARRPVEAGSRRLALLSGWRRFSISRDHQFGFVAERHDSVVELSEHQTGHFVPAGTREAVAQMMDRL
ncbi:MAG: hypothetical protein KDD88_00830 [Rhodobacteraceae bacterium]|nr:hypothetical protein [Paracoccaceae bacterium]